MIKTKSKDKHVLTVTLNPALDKVVTLTAEQSIPLGSRKQNALRYQEQSGNGSEHGFHGDVQYCAGGKGINVSRSLKSLKIKSLATGFCGGSTGRVIRQLLDREKIPHQFVDINGETRTNYTLIHPYNGRRSRIIEEGPVIKSNELLNFKRRMGSMIGQSCFVILSGRNAFKASDGLYADIIRTVHAQNVPVFLDTHGHALLKGLKAKPDLIKPNAAEAAAVLDQPVKSASDMRSALDEFHRKGVKVVLISLGGEGLVASDTQERLWVRSPSIDLLNDVGCGDALVAGYVAAHLRGKSFRDALMAGVAAGSASALNHTPGLISTKNLVQLLEHIQISRL